MSAAELDAAGITEPRLRAAYARCRRLNAHHGRTFFLATRLLPPARRPSVHALYGFARWADEIVDDLADGRGVAERAAALDHLAADLAVTLAGGRPGRGRRAPVLVALADTVRRHGIDPALFDDFLRSMRMDLTTTEYRTWDELAGYVRGSADVIGLQLLPVFGTVVPRAEAEPYAAAVGTAFQLTNFLRDVGEDLDRGRLYLPTEELAAFGVDRELLTWCRAGGRTDPRVRRALAYLVAYTRSVYRGAEAGVAMLAPAARPCVRTALTLYRGILDEIVAADYAVLGRRMVVPTSRRLRVALPAFGQVLLTRVVRPADRAHDAEPDLTSCGKPA
ncbi:phytoene synthase [Streptoalloteichus tenebrarius]|uniref:Phytoene synthase n=3 Tax=Streptoalloteichus tenebrarius (strain ATCC 17920 / DSM 40477 / JCM 4838 / CBS 697.72 / NBRC 16177 / NCIMB 11028 / NRRL B-12390 / A12253. 1 / ISP 5477) TaxID=1933 RepID=A0ABT1HMI6_STRSD|nr:phytoene synthase [Streptoalloteichus tenebrarius]BFF00369.1 phytoene/squalene synthase family protein [Streptoalloteichus tenebrarius]